MFKVVPRPAVLQPLAAAARRRDHRRAGGRHAAVARPSGGRSIPRTRSPGPAARRVAALPARSSPDRRQLRLRAERTLPTHEAHTRAMLDATVRDRSAHARRSRRSGTRFDWWLAEAPDAMQVVFVMSGVLLHEDGAPQGVQRRRVFATIGWSIRSWRRASARSARSRRSISSRWPSVARHEPRGDRRTCWRTTARSPISAPALAGTTFLDAFDRFLDQYGHRGRYESDWALPRLHENPAPALFAIRAASAGAAAGPRRPSRASGSRRRRRVARIRGAPDAVAAVDAAAARAVDARAAEAAIRLA